jgi:hypothetical protein
MMLNLYLQALGFAICVPRIEIRFKPLVFFALMSAVLITPQTTTDGSMLYALAGSPELLITIA